MTLRSICQTARLSVQLGCPVVIVTEYLVKTVLGRRGSFRSNLRVQSTMVREAWRQAAGYIASAMRMQRKMNNAVQLLFFVFNSVTT